MRQSNHSYMGKFTKAMFVPPCILNQIHPLQACWHQKRYLLQLLLCWSWIARFPSFWWHHHLDKNNKQKWVRAF